MNHLKDQIKLSGALPGLFLFLKDMRFRYCLPTADSFLGLPLLPFLHLSIFLIFLKDTLHTMLRYC